MGEILPALKIPQALLIPTANHAVMLMRYSARVKPHVPGAGCKQGGRQSSCPWNAKPLWGDIRPVPTDPGLAG